MPPLQYIRAIVLLLLMPPLTLLFSILAWTDAVLIRRSAAKVQVYPRVWARLLCRLAGVRVRLTGMENLQPDRTYIYVGNHASQFDIFSFQGHFPLDFRWVAKKELFRIPVFGPAMRRAGLIPIDRARGREALKSLHQAAERISAGTSVLIFPEGTRSTSGELQPFKTGAISLALKAGVPVVPVAFIGSHRILPKGRLLADSGEIVIRVGKPISISEYTNRDKQHLAGLLHDRVAELLAAVDH
ncbi:MAG: lysophospholipid acyltransferase family protein [Desulfobulbaceae bacterium]|nr:lysophospholipid acyltransferase family protein [Desulfobulbaceae bacterium]MDY0351066.1 lysophospholipid acyltransferase family protein [Desulfobulbaceae bacterium]